MFKAHRMYMNFCDKRKTYSGWGLLSESRKHIIYTWSALIASSRRTRIDLLLMHRRLVAKRFNVQFEAPGF